MTDETKNKVVFSPPDADAPGYLKRQRQVLGVYAEYKDNPTVETVDKLVGFLLPFVTEPKTKAKAEEALLEASQNQIKQLVEAMAGVEIEDKKGEENPT